MQPPPHQQQHQQHLDPTTLHDDTAAAAACRIDGRTGSEYRHYTIRHHPMNDDHHDQHSISSSSCTTLLLPSTFSSTFSDGCSELYDTLTHGTVQHLVCHVWAEFQSTGTTTSSTTSNNNSTTAPLVDISIQQLQPTTTTTTSMDQSRMTTTECETALQQYYVPCLRKSLVSLLSLPSSTTDAVVPSSSNNNNNTPSLSLWKLQIWVQIISSTTSTTTTSTLDAMVQVINAALLHTMVLPDPTTTTLVPQPLLSLPSFSPHEDDPTTRSLLRLPMVITTHVRLLGDHHHVIWADASTDEVSDVAVHVVVESTTTATASAVWITPRQLRGSSHHHHDGKLTPRIVQECVTFTLQVLAPNMTSYFCCSSPPP